jgi:hypothetical protein
MIDMTAAATPEMLARTQPQLLDLLVAVFAGFAGAYALVDERISPALPGVAIATAIVPPLATAGLCLSMGAYTGAIGAVLLFLANFVSILLVAMVTFSAAGLIPAVHLKSLRDWTRRFGVTVLGFVAIAAVLTHSFLRIAHEQWLDRSVRTTLLEAAGRYSEATLTDVVHEEAGDRLQVLATIRSYTIPSPDRVAKVEEALSEATGIPTDLVVRTVLAKDVAATGSNLRVTKPNLDGVFLTEEVPTGQATTTLAKQALLEALQREPGLDLIDATYGEGTRGEFILANLESIRPVTETEIADAEKILRERLQDPDLNLVVRITTAQLITSEGPLLIEWSSPGTLAREEYESAAPACRQMVIDAVRKELGMRPNSVYLNVDKDRWRVLVEVVGPDPVTREAVAQIQRYAAEEFPYPINVSLWHRSDYVCTPAGTLSFKEFTQDTLRSQIHQLPAVFKVATER